MKSLHYFLDRTNVIFYYTYRLQCWRPSSILTKVCAAFGKVACSKTIDLTVISQIISILLTAFMHSIFNIARENDVLHRIFQYAYACVILCTILRCHEWPLIIYRERLKIRPIVIDKEYYFRHCQLKVTVTMISKTQLETIYETMERYSPVTPRNHCKFTSVALLAIGSLFSQNNNLFLVHTLLASTFSVILWSSFMFVLLCKKLSQNETMQRKNPLFTCH